MNDSPEVFYRYTSDGDTLFCEEIPVLRRTEKGAWVDAYNTEKFVLLSAGKRWAVPTKEEALTSFIARKQKQIKILKAQLAHAEKQLALGLGNPATINPTPFGRLFLS